MNTVHRNYEERQIMTIPRVFVSYAISGGAQREDQFTTRLVNDLRAAGADVIVDEVSSTNDTLAQSLNQVLPGCNWLILVQTPAALHSPRVQLTVNTALNLVVQGRMQGVLRVITELCDAEDMPPTWTTLNQFDASKDYPRALTRVLLSLGLVEQPNLLQHTLQSYDIQSPASDVSRDRSSIDDRPVSLSWGSEARKSAIPSLVQLDRPLSPPTLSSSPRRRRTLLASLLLLLAALIVLIFVSIMIVYPRTNPDRSAAIPTSITDRSQAISTGTLHVKPGTTADSKSGAKTGVTPRPNATATAIFHSTPSSSPTTQAVQGQTPTPTSYLTPTPTLPPPPQPTPTSPPPPPPPSTHAETTGGNANTWTNYTNAGGYEGPTIPAYATVQITCKITGFVVADGNPWWYKVASSPWNNTYYVSADAFYNNGQTSGSLHGTPFVDSSVPNC